jgi:hypothetical protein
MNMRIRYLPIENAVIGMVLGDTVTDNHLRALLPSGAVLTDENLNQMLAHQVEFLCIAEPDTRSADEVSNDLATTLKQLEIVFERANLLDPLTKALFEQLLIYRSAQ